MGIEIIEGDWVIIDGIAGTTIYPREHFTIKEAVDDYGYDGVMSIDIEGGFGARFSQSGYLDSTEWIGPYVSEKDAKEILVETYGGDE